MDSLKTYQKMSRGRLILLGTITIIISLISGLIISEMILRLLRDPNQFLPYHAKTMKVFYPNEQITPGVTDPSYFTTNTFGTRGPEWRGEPIKILTIGGSTTACTVLDDSETWPALLMRFLNQEVNDEKKVWVTNSGVDGHHTHHHLMHAKYLLPLLPKINYVIVYAGLNDAGSWLYQKDFDPHFLENPNNWNTRVGEAFRVSHFTPANWPWYKHLEIWKRASVIKNRLMSLQVAKQREEGRITQDAHLQWLETARQQRQERRKKLVHQAKMETLPAALKAYSINLRHILNFIREIGAEPVLMAQAIQPSFKNEEERRLFWMGAMEGGEVYLKHEQMFKILKRYNERMQEIAVEEGVFFIDLPTYLASAKGRLFYDAVHFNELGAEKVAHVIADFFQKRILREVQLKKITD